MAEDMPVQAAACTPAPEHCSTAGHARAQVSDLQPQLQKLLSAGARAAPPAEAATAERVATAAARAPADAPAPAGGAAAGEADEGAPSQPFAGDDAAGARASAAGAHTPAGPAVDADCAAEGVPDAADADAPLWPAAAAGRAGDGLADGIGSHAPAPPPVGASGVMAGAATRSFATVWSAGGQPVGGAGAAPGGGAAGGLASGLSTHAPADVHLPSCADAHSAPSTSVAWTHGALPGVAAAPGELALGRGPPGAAGPGSAERTVTRAMPGTGHVRLAAGPQARMWAPGSEPGPRTGSRAFGARLRMPPRRPPVRAASARALPCRPARPPLGAPAARSVRMRAC